MNNGIKDLIKLRDRKRCDTVKAILEAYDINLRLIDEYQKEIEEKKENINYLRSSLSNANEVKGSGMAKDDILIRDIDKITDLKNEIKIIKKENQQVKNAINSIDDPIAKSIIMRIWVKNIDSMRSLATALNLSHTMIWRKSDTALLSLYKKLIK